MTDGKFYALAGLCFFISAAVVGDIVTARLHPERAAQAWAALDKAEQEQAQADAKEQAREVERREGPARRYKLWREKCLPLGNDTSEWCWKTYQNSTGLNPALREYDALQGGAHW